MKVYISSLTLQTILMALFLALICQFMQLRVM